MNESSFSAFRPVPFPRNGFLRLLAAGLTRRSLQRTVSPRHGLSTLTLIFCLGLFTGAAWSAESVSADQAVRRLAEGNERFATNAVVHPDQSSEHRQELTQGQAPFAIILTCSDSRVSPELLFDQGLGDLFVIRNAGNILDDHVIGSMEYAVEHLHVNLIVVLGHEKCGAVSAAVAAGEAKGHLRSVVEAIAPAVEETKRAPGDAADNAVRANAQRVAEILLHVDPVLKPAVAEGRLKILPARYDLDSGRVELLKSNIQTVSK
jgi:carbonic anhydrase